MCNDSLYIISCTVSSNGSHETDQLWLMVTSFSACCDTTMVMGNHSKHETTRSKTFYWFRYEILIVLYRFGQNYFLRYALEYVLYSLFFLSFFYIEWLLSCTALTWPWLAVMCSQHDLLTFLTSNRNRKWSGKLNYGNKRNGRNR